MSEIYDIVVVGGGPAGLAAGIYGSRARLNTVIVEKSRTGGQAASTEEMENYPGFFDGSTGPGITAKMTEHAEHFGTGIIKDDVVELALDGQVKSIKTRSGQEIQGKTVVLCPGAEPRSLNIKGEHRLRGKGVSYCATCDADFFEDLDVIVVGNGDAAIEEAMYLTKFATSVTIIVIHDEGILDCNKASAEKAFQNKKLKWVWSSVLEEIKGEVLVESVVVKNINTGELSEMPIDGVFFFVGTVPKTAFLKETNLEMNEQGYLIANEMMETNLPGVYAAGDARVKYLRQVVTACADGAIASVAAQKYIEEMETFHEQVMESEKPVLLTFWAPQVEASFAAVGMLESLVEESGNAAKLVKMDTYRNKKIAAMYDVTEIPAVVVIDKGQVKGKLSGAFSKEEVASLLK